MPRKVRRKRAAALAESALNLSAEEKMPDISMANIDREEHAKNILQDIENEVEIRCQKIQREAECLALQMKNAFHVELVKIPKGIRSMPLKQFCEEYGEDIATFLKVSMDNNIQIATTHHGKKSYMPITTPGHGRSIPQTPGFFPETPACPPTQMRAPRPGEVMLSSNGSPLGVAGSTSVELKDKGKIQIAMELQDGKQLELDPADARVANLPDDMKQSACSKLKNLQDEIHGLLSQLEQKN